MQLVLFGLIPVRDIPFARIAPTHELLSTLGGFQSGQNSNFLADLCLYLSITRKSADTCLHSDLIFEDGKVPAIFTQ